MPDSQCNVQINAHPGKENPLSTFATNKKLRKPFHYAVFSYIGRELACLLSVTMKNYDCGPVDDWMVPQTEQFSVALDGHFRFFGK